MILSEKTKLTFTIGNLITLVTTVFFIAGVWYHLDAQIEEAKTLGSADDTRYKFNYNFGRDKNDKVVREAVLKMNADMQYIKEEISEIKSRLDKMEERLYELKR